MELLRDGGLSGPAWAFFGSIVAGIVAILVEQIRNRRKTEDVGIDIISRIDQVDKRLDEHIQWHLSRTLPIVPHQRRRQ